MIFLDVLDQVRNDFHRYPVINNGIGIHNEKVEVLEKIDKIVDEIVDKIVDERIGESIVKMFVVGNFFHLFWRKYFICLKYFPMNLMNFNHHYKVVFKG